MKRFFLGADPAIRCIFCVTTSCQSFAIHPPHKRMSLLSGLKSGHPNDIYSIDSHFLKSCLVIKHMFFDFYQLRFVSHSLFETSVNCVLFHATCWKLLSIAFCFLQSVLNFCQLCFVSSRIIEP